MLGKAVHVLIPSIGWRQKICGFKTNLGWVYETLFPHSFPAQSKRKNLRLKLEISCSVVSQHETLVLLFFCVSHAPLMTENTVSTVLKGEKYTLLHKW